MILYHASTLIFNLKAKIHKIIDNIRTFIQKWHL